MLPIAEQLGSTGLCVFPGFLSPELLRDTKNDLELIRSAGGFERAGTGKDRQVRDLVRRDEIHWLNRVSPNAVQSALWDRLDSLKQAFNRVLYLGLSEFEGHYAVYPENGFYERHLDCFKQDDARTVSLVLYLNLGWRPADGGRLRIYKGDSHVDIDPVGGTLVCFLSRESEHEVLPSRGARFSFTGWFK